MLAASGSTPNPSAQGSPESLLMQAPLPQGWPGVTQSLKNAFDLMRGKDHVRAEDVLLRLLEFAPMEGKAWHMLGRCHQEQQRHGKALECFDRAACCYRQTSDKQAPASSRLAQLLWDQGETAQAETMLDRLLSDRPEDEKLLVIKQQWQTQASPAAGVSE